MKLELGSFLSGALGKKGDSNRAATQGKFNPNARSSFAVIVVLFLSTICGTGYYGYKMGRGKQVLSKAIGVAKLKQYNAEDDGSILRKKYASGLHMYEPAQEFMHRIDGYRAISEFLEANTGDFAQRLLKDLCVHEHVLYEKYDSRVESHQIGGNTYVGRVVSTTLRGDFSSVGQVMADLENAVPLLRFLSVHISPASGSDDAGKVEAIVKYIIIKNIKELGDKQSPNQNTSASGSMPKEIQDIHDQVLNDLQKEEKK